MRIRRSSRLILIDTESRVLLFRIEDATVFRAGESSPRVLLDHPGRLPRSRGELRHRGAAGTVGRDGDDRDRAGTLGRPLRAANWAGELIRAHNRFFFARIDSTAVTFENLNAAEREVFRDHRCWNVEELRASGERVVPPGLVDLLLRIIAGDVPSQPVRLK